MPEFIEMMQVGQGCRSGSARGSSLPAKTPCMIQHIKKYFAIRSYMLRLSQELVRRFGKQPYYSVEQVTQAVQRSGLSAASIIYAHAAYCRQEDFAAFYEPLGLANRYQSLRQTIARRYFSGRSAYDAQTIIRRFVPGRVGSGEFHESDIGSSWNGH